jgi:hypothetical protein
MQKNNVLSYFIKDINNKDHLHYKQQTIYLNNNRIGSLCIFEENKIIFEYNAIYKIIIYSEIEKWLSNDNTFRYTGIHKINKFFKSFINNMFKNIHISNDLHIEYSFYNNIYNKWKKCDYAIYTYYKTLKFNNYYYKFSVYIQKLKYGYSKNIIYKTIFLNRKYELNYYSKLFRLIKN